MRVILSWFIGLSVLILAGLVLLYFLFVKATIPDQPPLSGDFQMAEVTVEGVSRRFHYYKPALLSAGAPLVFALHGSQASGEVMRAQLGYEFDRLADQHGFIVVYPDGFEKHWNDCRVNASYSANTQKINDVAFFRDMVSFFEGQYPIDTRRIYATGFSNGGHMAYRLAYELPERFAAVAAIAANLPEDDNSECKASAAPISVAIFNGTEDTTNPYNGGLVTTGGDASRGAVVSSARSAEYWARLSQLTQEVPPVQLPEVDGDNNTHVVLTRWLGIGDLGEGLGSESSDNIEVRLYTLRGSGHVIPSKLVKFGAVMGGNAGDIEAAEEIWQFFSGQALRGY